MLNENQFEVNKPIEIGGSSNRSLEQKIPVKVRAIEESESIANWRFLKELELNTASTLNDFSCWQSNTQTYRPLKFALQLILSIFPDVLIESCSSDFSNCTFFLTKNNASQIAEELLYYQWICEHLELFGSSEKSLIIVEKAYINQSIS